MYTVCWSLEEAMAVGLAITSEEGQYNAKMTAFVVLSCMIAATGGIIFGYDIGISGPFFFEPLYSSGFQKNKNLNVIFLIYVMLATN